MRSSWLLLFTAVLDSAAAGDTLSSAAVATEWVAWSTGTIYTTIYDTSISYVTVAGPTTTKTDYQTYTETDFVSVTGPTTTITYVSTTTQVDQVTLPPITVTSVRTVPQTIIETSSQTVEQTVAVTVPQTIVETSSQTVEQTVPVTVPVTVVNTNTVQNTATVVETQTIKNAITATITTISRITEFVSAPASCPSAILSGLVTCPTRIINPTYTPPTPLPSNYLWGCPPGLLCHPKREGCNFEQNLPAMSYVCAPEECLPVAELPTLEAFLAANQQSNDSCAWLTPVDDYFNLNPLFFGLDFGIFNVYGQATCTPTSSCAAPSTVTVQGSSNWAVWSGPAPTSASGSGSVAPPTVTKRAEVKDKELMKRQFGQPLIAYESCIVQCLYVGYVWESIGMDPRLCSAGGDYSNAYSAATSCNDLYTGGGGGTSRILTEVDAPSSYCAAIPQKRFVHGRRS